MLKADPLISNQSAIEQWQYHKVEMHERTRKELRVENPETGAPIPLTPFYQDHSQTYLGLIIGYYHDVPLPGASLLGDRPNPFRSVPRNDYISLYLGEAYEDGTRTAKMTPVRPSPVRVDSPNFTIQSILRPERIELPPSIYQ